MTMAPNESLSLFPDDPSPLAKRASVLLTKRAAEQSTAHMSASKADLVREALSYAVSAHSQDVPISPQNLIELGCSEEAAESLSEAPFWDALARRGINKPTSSRHVLSERQVHALSILTNVTDRRSPRTKLSSIGVEWYEYQAWSHDPLFARQHRALSEKNLRVTQGLVLDAVTTAAASGDLNAAKYFNQLSGRYDPNTITAEGSNVREMLAVVSEILQEELAGYPELMRAIGGRMAVVIGVGELERKAIN